MCYYNHNIWSWITIETSDHPLCFSDYARWSTAEIESNQSNTYEIPEKLDQNRTHKAFYKQ